MVPQDCGKCAFDPALKKQWGCTYSLQTARERERIPDDQGNTVEYYNCPIGWIVPSVWSFSDKYLLTKKGLVAPVPYEREQARYLAYINYYEKWFGWFIKRKQRNE